jgi:hypothetical protein
MRLLRSIIRSEPYNEHVFAPRATDAVRMGLIGKNAIGVTDRSLSRYRRVQMESAYIAQTVRLQNPDLVVFHTPTQDEAMARIAVGALHGTRQRMMTYRYDARPVQRGTLRRVVLSRISMWVVPTAPAGRVLEAAGIDRERIRVLRPPVRRPRTIEKGRARAELEIPTGKPVVTVSSPSASEVALLAPTLERMQDYEQGYTLVVSDASEPALTTIAPLVAASQGQAVLVQTEQPSLTSLQPGLPTPVLLDRSELLASASDAALVLDWDQSVKQSAIEIAMSGREILTVRTEESEEATGDTATFIQADTPAQVTSALTSYAPDAAKGQGTAAFVRQEYDEDSRVKDHRQAHLDTLPVRARQRGDAVPAA